MTYFGARLHLTLVYMLHIGSIILGVCHERART